MSIRQIYAVMFFATLPLLLLSWIYNLKGSIICMVAIEVLTVIVFPFLPKE